ncbi:MAG: hypothetical protein M3376_14575, partial [Actinomycetota bacterium]|nr:hypothetical protein [Actinomycetota bacterium]
MTGHEVAPLLDQFLAADRGVQRRLAREREGGGDHAVHALGLQMQDGAAFVEVVAQGGEALAHAALLPPDARDTRRHR